MDKKSKLLYCLAVISILSSVAYTFHQTVILKDYVIEEIPEEEIVDIESDLTEPTTEEAPAESIDITEGI